MCVPAPQTTPQAPLTQPWPVGHGVQSVPSIVPQVSDELLLTQMPPQRCQPLLQSGVHTPVVPLQVTVPLSGAEQAVQVLPHELTLVLLLAVQVAVAPVPHWWKLLLQSTPQVVPLQTGLPFGGSTHAVQPVAVHPDAVLLFATHDVGAALGQPWKPVAQVTLQVVPVHAAVPLVGVAHAVQPLAVQPEATLLSATQAAFAPAPHKWKPVLQARTQFPAALQVTVPFAGAVQTVQLFPHEVIAVLPLITHVAVAPVPH
jgi:hypothetical protein